MAGNLKVPSRAAREDRLVRRMDSERREHKAHLSK